VELPTPSLVVYLHREANSCISSFSGALMITTRNTIDGIAELIVGEISVALDFSQVDVVDVNGVDATKMLIQSVRLRGSHLQVIEPKRRENRGFLIQQRAVCATDRICALGPTNQRARYRPVATK
jgi:anti-anti-sigma regulatory factor